MKRKTGLSFLAAGLLAGSLSGCFFRPVDELYAVPQPSQEYEALQEQLSKVIAAGGEYAAPLTGELIQSVQLQDLDGDGVREAIAFFRFPGEEKPMKIYIFRQVRDAYELLTVVEGAGTAINCVDYVQLDDSPFQELVVSWQMSSQLGSLAAYSIGPDGNSELLRTDYGSYHLADLDSDGQQELVVLRSMTGSGCEAVLYDRENDFLPDQHAALSEGITALASGGVCDGKLSDGIPALFVTSGYRDSGVITDILTYVSPGGTLTNVTCSPETGESGDTIRYNSQLPVSDLNGDGILELPQPVPLAEYRVTSTAVNFWLTHWRQFDNTGEGKTVFSTYHNERDGWYLVLPDSWGSDLVLSRSDAPGGAERSVTFYRWNGDEAVEPRAFLTISRLSGTRQDQLAQSGERFVLLREGSGGTSKITYTAEFRDGWDCGLSQEELKERFHLIKTDWFEG